MYLIKPENQILFTNFSAIRKAFLKSLVCAKNVPQYFFIKNTVAGPTANRADGKKFRQKVVSRSKRFT